MTSPYPGGEYGPWDDLDAATAPLDDAYALDAQRMAEDITDSLERRPSAETKIAQAMRRIEAGTYTEPEQFRPARDAGGQYSAACGPLTDLGTCGSRYHQAGCYAIAEGRMSRGSVAEAEAWNAGLLRHVAHRDLSTPADPDPLGGGGDTWASLLRSPGGLFSEPEIRARIMAVLDGEAAADPGYEPVPAEARPPVTSLRTALGL
jgi:hypothetical protein